MTCSSRSVASFVVVALATFGLGCSSAGAPERGTYTLDLDALGGLQDANSSIAFPIDLAEQTKKISRQGPTEILEIYDRVGCWAGAAPSLESASESANIAEGDSANVVSLDLVVGIGDLGSTNGVCAGQRAPGGKWTFDLKVYEPSAGKVHIPIAGGPMDALGIAFESNYPPSIREIQFTVE